MPPSPSTSAAKRRRCDYVVPMTFTVEVPCDSDSDDEWDDEATPEETQRELARCLAEELNCLQNNLNFPDATVVFAPAAVGEAKAALPSWAALQPEAAVPILPGRTLSREERDAIMGRLNTTDDGWTQPLTKQGVTLLLHALNLQRARLARSLTELTGGRVRFSYDDFDYSLYDDTFLFDVMKVWPSGLLAMFTRKPEGFLFDYASAVFTLPDGDQFRLDPLPEAGGKDARTAEEIPKEIVDRRAQFQASMYNFLLGQFGLDQRVEPDDIPMAKIPAEGIDLTPSIEKLVARRFPHAEDYLPPTDDEFHTMLSTLEQSNAKHVMITIQPSARGRRLLQGGGLLQSDVDLQNDSNKTSLLFASSHGGT